MNSFFSNGVASWNVMIKHFKIFPLIGKLKEYLISLFRPNIKSTFDIHDPTGLRYIFQLRLKLSALRSLNGVISLLLLRLISVVAIKVLKLLIIFYSRVLFRNSKTLITTVHEIEQRNNLNDFRNQPFIIYMVIVP